MAAKVRRSVWVARTAIFVAAALFPSCGDAKFPGASYESNTSVIVASDQFSTITVAPSFNNSALAETNSAEISALTAARGLVVKGRAPQTGYSRDEFGQPWTDVDHNGCDTRNDILHRDLVNVTVKPGTNDCVVLTGTLFDNYSEEIIYFQRGTGSSNEVQIDHIVALSDAWQKGAQGWSEATRIIFANDPLNLAATKGAINAAKGDGDTATWLPPNRAFRCDYVARQVAVKHLYELWVTAAEQAAMIRILNTCPEQPLPTGGYLQSGSKMPIAGIVAPRNATTTPDIQGAPNSPSPKIQPPSSPIPPGPINSDANLPSESITETDPRFDTCKAAKAAGYGPYLQNVNPEYNWYRDSDHDGIVCE